MWVWPPVGSGWVRGLEVRSCQGWHVGRLTLHVVHGVGLLSHRWHAQDRPRGCPHCGATALPSWQPRLLALGFPLLCRVSLHKGALHLGSDIRVGLGVLDAHVLVIEGETLQGAGHWWCCDLVMTKAWPSSLGSVTPACPGSGQTGRRRHTGTY